MAVKVALDTDGWDRFVNVGCPGRPFATEDPKSEDLLPADDAAWDDGVSGNALRNFLSMLMIASGCQYR